VNEFITNNVHGVSRKLLILRNYIASILRLLLRTAYLHSRAWKEFMWAWSESEWTLVIKCSAVPVPECEEWRNNVYVLLVCIQKCQLPC